MSPGLEIPYLRNNLHQVDSGNPGFQNSRTTSHERVRASPSARQRCWCPTAGKSRSRCPPFRGQPRAVPIESNRIKAIAETHSLNLPPDSALMIGAPHGFRRCKLAVPSAGYNSTVSLATGVSRQLNCEGRGVKGASPAGTTARTPPQACPHRLFTSPAAT